MRKPMFYAVWGGGEYLVAEGIEDARRKAAEINGRFKPKPSRESAELVLERMRELDGIAFEPLTARKPEELNKAIISKPKRHIADVEHRMMMCLNDGTVYENASVAARHFNLSPNSVLVHAKNGRPTSLGLRFQRVPGMSPCSAPECLAVLMDGKELFESAAECAALTGIHVDLIVRHLFDGGRTASGHSFRYACEEA